MPKQFKPNLLHYFFAVVWIINGLLCKVFNLVPRHKEIVDRILHTEYTSSIVLAIGIAEIGMAGWVLSGIQRRICSLIQIIIIAVMNTLEFFLAPDLLLWGQVNALFALMLILLIYVNEFYFASPKPRRQHA
ncbi:MAG TPA: DoxX-like family protein [Chitinophagaceae bacterium]